MDHVNKVSSVRISSLNMVLGLGMLVLMCAMTVSSEEFEEGKHYELIERQSETQSDEQAPSDDDESVEASEIKSTDDDTSRNDISVVEYFSYGCAHCYRLEPTIDAWLATKAEDVVFSRVAVPSRKDWVPLARAYNMAEVLGITEKVHSLIFRAIFVNNQPIEREHLLKRMFVGVADVEPEKFDEVMKSEEIPGMIQKAVLEMRDFGITASPTIVVAERYLITPETAGDLGLMFEVVDFLVAKIKTERETEETAAANEPTD